MGLVCGTNQNNLTHFLNSSIVCTGVVFIQTSISLASQAF